MNIDERVTRIEERLRVVEEEVRHMDVTIEGPPRPESIRGRLHNLETNDAAARAATAALEAARAMRTETFTRREKLTALLFGTVTSVCTIITTVLVVGFSK